MTITTRFAPSPTGRLHVGNIRTALHNYLLAAQGGGRFLLRIDDTDLERSREEHVADIVADLDWLGLIPAATFRQSERFDLYEREFERLRAASVSSIRSRKRPPRLRASSQLCSAVRILPTWSRPVGEGAKRVTVMTARR